MRRVLLTSALALLSFATALAQVEGARTVTGSILDADGEPLIGATVLVKGSSLGTVADLDGSYELTVPEAATTLVFSFIGYGTVELPIGDADRVDAVLEAGAMLDEVVLVGSRTAGRTKLTTPVPVDLVDVKELASTSAQTNVNQLLNYVAPSFSSNTQTISDGTDHIDPASLRGLGPDQVLVLVNGKRRHNTSLVNVNGTFGRGNVGTDLNAIPVAAIERIEILRDGASAQYGSDAIAGVINIILKDDLGLSFTSETGAYFSSEIPEVDGNVDGQFAQLSGNYGLPVGTKGGYVNFTGTFDNREPTNRMKAYSGTIFQGFNNSAVPVDSIDQDITDIELANRGLTRSDFNMRVGQSGIRNGGFMANANVPIGDAAEFYAFGGLNYRRGNAAGFYRLPFQERTVTSIYPNGFLPEINSNIADQSLAAGIRGLYNQWEVDFSNVFGRNSFDYFITNTLNASLGAASPTSFNAGGFSFEQNTANLDVRRYFDDALAGLNVAFGGEYRFENYQILPGEEASYRNYGLASQYITTQGDTVLIVDGSGPINTVFGPNGDARPGGAQVFPGFRSENAVNAYRSSVGFYGDVEADLTDILLVGLAGRFENYSDFGSTLNGKLTARVKVSEDISVRGAASTGFRAPSLHQLNYNSTSTLFVDGIPNEVGTFSNDSRVAKLLGIPQLKQERSRNFSAGVTARFPSSNLSLTVDGYLVDINDRVVLTGQFGSKLSPEIARLLREANATSATFFANAIDSRTRGIDVVLSHAAPFGAGQLNTSIAGTFAKTTLQQINAGGVLAGQENTFFDPTSQIFLETAVPRTKVNGTANYQVNGWTFFLRGVYFGQVEEATNEPANAQTYDGKVVTDASVGYRFNDRIGVTIGANNIFDVYPDLNIPANQSSGRFLYSRRSQQFGANGRYLFARARFTL